MCKVWERRRIDLAKTEEMNDAAPVIGRPMGVIAALALGKLKRICEIKAADVFLLRSMPELAINRAFLASSRDRNPDAEAICDLAMYNYIEVN